MGGKNDDVDAEGSGDGDKGGLSAEDAADVCAWLTATLGPSKVSNVKTTNRLGSSPAIITNHESGAMRRMMRMVDTQGGSTGGLDIVGPQEVEVNSNHPLIKGIHGIKDEDIAKDLAEQIYDNALVAAGIMDDPRGMLGRINMIMEKVVEKKGE